jgi:hypothetical protein
MVVRNEPVANQPPRPPDLELTPCDPHHNS